MTGLPIGLIVVGATVRGSIAFCGATRTHRPFLFTLVTLHLDELAIVGLTVCSVVVLHIIVLFDIFDLPLVSFPVGVLLALVFLKNFKIILSLGKVDHLPILVPGEAACLRVEKATVFLDRLLLRFGL